MDMEIKGFGGFEVKDADKGEVSAIVATLNVVDRDKDVFLPNSVQPASRVQISDYKHSVVLAGAPPVGKGSISIDGDLAIFTGQYFMGTERGRESFAMVKEIGPDGDWSFAFPKGPPTIPMTKEWQAKGARRLIAGPVNPLEVSPVLRGGGIGTRTLAAKEATMETKAHRVVCDCGRVLGESPESLVFIGKVKELADVTVKGPRDVRYCKKCSLHAVHVPVSSLTRPAA